MTLFGRFPDRFGGLVFVGGKKIPCASAATILGIQSVRERVSDGADKVSRFALRNRSLGLPLLAERTNLFATPSKLKTKD
jgi:hypothetical protein